MRSLVTLILLVATLAAGNVRADELWIGSGGSGAIQIKGATIVRIEAGQIFFLAAGKETSRELGKIQRIMVENEPALNAAEEAYVAAKWNDAVDGYQKTIRATTKAWLKDWSTSRLIDSANKSGRFDAAVSAYLAMLLKDPGSAAAMRPTLPNERSTYLDQAVSEVNAALSGKTLTDEQRQSLLTFLIDLHRARNDKPALERVAEQIDELLAKDPNNPAAGQAIARRKLQRAAKAIEARDYRNAVAEIESARARFTEPQQQAEALFLLAEAVYGQSDPKNHNSLKDAALAYMRVVAHFKNDPQRPYVAEALLRTATIHEQLGEPQTAIAIYEQVAAQFKDLPAAQTARQGLQRLGRQNTPR